MEFQIPKKGESVICVECRANFPHVFRDCNAPCSHLISWVSHELRRELHLQLRLFDDNGNPTRG